MAVAIWLPIVISAGLAAASAGIQVLTIRKMKQPPTERGKNDDIRIMGSDYGAYIPRVWGTVRIAPNLIHSTGVRVVRRETTQGGGGGGKGGPPPQRVVEYSYYTTIQLLACANEIQSINKIWANTDLIYSMAPSPNNFYAEAEDATLAGGANVVTDAYCSTGEKVTDVGNGGTVTFAIPASTLPTDEIEDTYTLLTVYYKAGDARNLTVTPNAGSPITQSCPAVGGNLPRTTTYHLEGHPTSIQLGNASGDAPDIDRIALFQGYTIQYPDDFPVTGIPDPYIDFPENPYESHTYYNYRPRPHQVTGTTTFQTANTGNIRIYTGTSTQTQDSAIVADLNRRFGSGQGAARASAHRGYAYVVMEDHLIPNGNLENFTFEINQGTTALAQIVEDLYAEKGISNSLVDTTALAGKAITGIVVNSLTSPQKIIEQLEIWFQFKMVEVDGIMKAILSEGDSEVTIPRQDLRAHLDGDTAPEFDAQITETNEEDLSKTVYVGYLDKNLDGKNNTQQSDLFASTLATDVKNLNFPFTATDTEAKGVADRIILEEHARSKQLEFYAPPKYSKYAVGDHVTLELANANHQVQITKEQKSLGGVVRFNAVSTENVHINDESNMAANVSDILPDTVRTALANTEAFIFESVPVELAHRGLGVYIGICGQGIGNWRGGSVFHKLVSAEDWIPFYTSQTPAPIGVAQGTLGNHTTDAEDETNELTIYFHTPVSLESVTEGELDVRIERNLVRVGNEWVQFRTATAETLPPASNFRSAWTISNLRRGKLGTMDERANHTANEKCLVYGDGVDFVVVDAQYNQQQVEFRPVTAGRTIDHAFSQNLIITGKSLRERNVPPPPCTIVMNAVPTNTTAQIRVTNYPLTTRFRKIEWSATSSDLSTDVTTQVISSETLPNSLLPEIQEVVTTPLSSATGKYIAVSHSNDNIEWSGRSNILNPTFASSGGTGGSMGNTPPTFTSVVYDSANSEVDLVFAKNGSATGNIQVEYKKTALSEWVTHPTTFPHNATTGSLVIAEEETAQTYDMRLKQIGVLGTSTAERQVVVDASGTSGMPPTNLVENYQNEVSLGEYEGQIVWTNGTGAGTHTVEVKSTFNGNWGTVATGITSADYNYTHFSMTTGKTYQYRVKQEGVDGYTNTLSIYIPGYRF